LEHADEIAMRKLSPLFLSTSLCWMLSKININYG
jgi:hypothetical protein